MQTKPLETLPFLISKTPVGAFVISQKSLVVISGILTLFLLLMVAALLYHWHAYASFQTAHITSARKIYFAGFGVLLILIAVIVISYGTINV